MGQRGLLDRRQCDSCHGRKAPVSVKESRAERAHACGLERKLGAAEGRFQGRAGLTQTLKPDWDFSGQRLSRGFPGRAEGQGGKFSSALRNRAIQFSQTFLYLLIYLFKATLLRVIRHV